MVMLVDKCPAFFFLPLPHLSGVILRHVPHGFLQSRQQGWDPIPSVITQSLKLSLCYFCCRFYILVFHYNAFQADLALTIYLQPNPCITVCLLRHFSHCGCHHHHHYFHLRLHKKHGLSTFYVPNTVLTRFINTISLLKKFWDSYYCHP